MIPDINPNKPVILGIEDNPMYAAVLQKFFTNDVDQCKNMSWQPVIVDNLADAARILFDPKLDVRGVVTDNNFPLISQGEPRRTPRDINMPNELSEGAAGIMAVRLMRGGDAGLKSDDTKEVLEPIFQEIKGKAGADWDRLVERNKTIPLVWNTENFEKGKEAMVKLAASGKSPEDPTLPLYTNHEESIKTVPFEFLDEAQNTAWVKKGPGGRPGEVIQKIINNQLQQGLV